MADKAQAPKADAPPKGRRYVGTRETLGFVLFDVAANVNLNDYAGEFTDRILNIDKGVQAMLGPITTIWDVVNDLLCAAWVDKTRTRFGKFRPYLVLYPLYGIPMTLLTYMLPYIFGFTTDSTYLPKIVMWALVSMFNEFTGTFGGICRTGMIANITPDVEERLLLITKANFFSMFGEDFPKQVFGVLRDIISRATAKYTALQIRSQMRTLFLFFGTGTILISGALSLYFALISKERVFGADAAKEKPPTVRESMMALKNNRPLLMLMLSDLLDGFSLKSQGGTYHNAILNFANFGLVSGIPGSPFSYISYAWVPKLRQRFSTKSLWLVSSYITQIQVVPIFFFGMMKIKNPAKLSKGVTRMFMDLVPMLIVYGIQNTVSMCFYGCMKVIPEEIRNECIDYGEWKNGFRSEGMVGVLRGLPKKLTNMVGNTLTNAILKLIGFKTGIDYNNQDESTAIGVFSMATIIPILSSIFALIPKLFFNINQKDREIMYKELAGRRAAAAAAHAGIGDTEESA